MTINQLIEKYQSDRDYYLTNKYNETLLRSDFLELLVRKILRKCHIKI